MRRWFPLLGALWTWAFAINPAAAAAPEPSPEQFLLDWQAPAACPNRETAKREIDFALEQLSWRGKVMITAVVTPQAGEPGFRLRVRVSHDGQTGERALAIEDCEDASRVAALLVALSVGNPPVAASPAPSIELTRAPPASAPARPTRSWSLGLGPHLAGGTTPELTAGLGVSLAYSHALWRLSLRGAGFAPSHHSAPGSALGGTFSLLTGGLFGCAGYPGQALRAYACLGGRVDHLEGRGTGSSTTFRQSTRIGSLGAGITLEWELTRRFALRTELEASYALASARFVIASPPTSVLVHEVHGLRAEAALEMAVAF